MERTKHYNRERKRREEVIAEIGEGIDIDEFIVDRGHVNGAEVHVITSNAIIKIYNQTTKKLVTKLIARPQQIKRYYQAEGKRYPSEIVEIARAHQILNLNYA